METVAVLGADVDAAVGTDAASTEAATVIGTMAVGM
jgi:hypothetical protein